MQYWKRTSNAPKVLLLAGYLSDIRAKRVCGIHAISIHNNSRNQEFFTAFEFFNNIFHQTQWSRIQPLMCNCLAVIGIMGKMTARVKQSLGQRFVQHFEINEWNFLHR